MNADQLNQRLQELAAQPTDEDVTTALVQLNAQATIYLARLAEAQLAIAQAQQQNAATPPPAGGVSSEFLTEMFAAIQPITQIVATARQHPPKTELTDDLVIVDIGTSKVTWGDLLRLADFHEKCWNGRRELMHA